MNKSEKFTWVEDDSSSVVQDKQQILMALELSPGAKKLTAEELAKMVDQVYLLIKKIHEEYTAKKIAA